jgi:hypothetical protein
MKDQVLYSFYVLFCLEANLCPSSLCDQLRSFEGYPGSFFCEKRTQTFIRWISFWSTKARCKAIIGLNHPHHKLYTIPACFWTLQFFRPTLHALEFEHNWYPVSYIFRHLLSAIIRQPLYWLMLCRSNCSVCLFIFFERLESVQTSRRNIMASLIFCPSSFCVRYVLRKLALYEAEFDIRFPQARRQTKGIKNEFHWHATSALVA